MRNVIARCLQKDPTQRPTATDLLQDKFFKVCVCVYKVWHVGVV